MKTVTVAASRRYDVLIGPGLLREAGAFAAEAVRPCRAAIVSDDTVDTLYGAAAEEAFARAGFAPERFAFPHGEASKNLNVLGETLNFLAGKRLSRSDVVVALGGGVAGDLAGFAAACYLRGVQYIQIPTTLLAAVDSSVGGKTAVDLPAGKNLAGAFHQPSLVLCDTDLLGTLPERTFREGAAEVAKYGVLEGGTLFARLERGLSPADADLADVIAACVDCKRRAVEGDEFDRGARQLLNLGHTMGHAVELLSDYRLYHGECVAIGLAAVTRAACRKGLCPAGDAARIETLLRRLGLPTETDCDPDDVFRVCGGDKKIRGGEIRLVVPEGVGHCTLRPMPLGELRGWIEAGLRP